MSTHSYNRLRGIVQSLIRNGSNVHVLLEGHDGELFTTVLTTAAADRLELAPGDELEATMQVAEVAANGRRAQSVVRTHTPVWPAHDRAGFGDTAV